MTTTATLTAPPVAPIALVAATEAARCVLAAMSHDLLPDCYRLVPKFVTAARYTKASALANQRVTDLDGSV